MQRAEFQGGLADGYIRRVLDDELDDRMSKFAAVSIEGPRAVGKTESARRRSRTLHLLDGPFEEHVRADPQIVRDGEVPILVDEWQRVPSTWDVVRRAVDAGAKPGSFLMTGSASGRGAHSGAGRIISVRMRPMTLAERGVGEPSVSLQALLGAGRPEVRGRSGVTLRRYAEEIVASGFPAASALDKDGTEDFLESYCNRIAERDLEEFGYRVRRPGTLLRWMRAYAAATSTTATFETIRDAATGGEGEKPARSVTLPYREMLERLYIVDPLPAWVPVRSKMLQLTAPPKHHLADPALAASLIGADVSALLAADPIGPPIVRDGTLLGAFFESLATLSVRVFAQKARAAVRHMRTARGEHEIDLIVERRDGRVLAIEVKLTAVPDDDDVRQLRWLSTKIGDELVDAIVLTTGEYAYRRSDGIAVVPLALLGP